MLVSSRLVCASSEQQQQISLVRAWLEQAFVVVEADWECVRTLLQSQTLACSLLKLELVATARLFKRRKFVLQTCRQYRVRVVVQFPQQKKEMEVVLLSILRGGGGRKVSNAAVSAGERCRLISCVCDTCSNS